MKKAIILVSGLFLTNATYSSTESVVMAPNKDHIEQYKKRILSDCKMGSIMRYGLMAVSLGALSYVMYTLFNKKKLKPCNVSILDNQQLTNKVRNLEIKYNKQFGTSWFSKKWFKKISFSGLNTFLSTVAGSFLGSAINKAFSHYDCFSDIDLFLKKRLGSLSVLDELFYNAKIIDIAKNEKCENLSAKQDRFIVACRNVIPFIEQVIAFMEYKIDQFAHNDLSLSKEEISVPAYLFDCTKDFCKSVESYLLGEATKDSLLFLSSEFKEEVARCIKSFNYMETRISWLLR